MRKRSLSNKGITLVELLIYLGLSMVMIVILSELFVSILNESTEVQNYSATQTDGRYIMSRIKNHLRNATSVSVSAGSELVLVSEGIEYHYHLVDSKLYVSDGVHDSLVSNLDSTITDLVFTQTGNAGGKPVITIQFTSSSGTSGTAQYESETFKGAGGLR